MKKINFNLIYLLVSLLVIGLVAFSMREKLGFKSSAGSNIPAACQPILDAKKTCHANCNAQFQGQANKTQQGACHQQCNSSSWTEFMNCMRQQPRVPMPTGGTK